MNEVDLIRQYMQPLEIEPLPEDKIAALRGQQALGVLAQMGGRNVGQFGQALYQGGSKGIQDERQAYNDRAAIAGKGLENTKRMLEGKKLIHELQTAGQGKWKVEELNGRLVKVNDTTGEVVPISMGATGAGGQEGQGYTYSHDELVDFGKLRESDATGVMYSKNAAPAIGMIRTLIDQGFEPSASDSLLYQTGGIGATGYVANKMASPESQAFVSDAKNLVAALLRRESGAAINAEEWAQGRQRWIPMPGDSPERARAKLDRAEQAARAIASTLPYKANEYLQGWISHHSRPQAIAEDDDGVVDVEWEG